jgi:trigger factor
VIEVPEEEIQEQLDRVVESNTPYEAAPEGTKAENGHKVMMNFLGKIDGEPFDGGKAENTPIVLGSGQFIPGFEEQIIGVKAGENKTIEVTFPDDYRAEHLAGKTAQFDVEVLSVEVPGKVEVNDEFAQQLGVESVEKLREAIRDSIQSEYDKLTERRVKRLVLDALDDAHKFDVPEQLVEQEFNSIWERVKHEIEHHGRSFEDEGTTEEDARKDYQRIAERRVRLGLVVAEIGSKNEIQVTEDEHKQALMAEVQRFPGQEQEVYDYYLKNQNALQSLRAPIFESKVIAFVTELADVKDETVTKDELIKLVEEDNEDEVPEAHVHHDHDHDHHDHDHDHDH